MTDTTSAAPKATDGLYYVYVSVSGEKKIAVYRMDAKTGELTPSSEIELPGAPGSLALGPEQKYMYAAVRSTGSVATMKLDHSNGKLTLVDSAKVVASPVYIKVEKTGNFLLTAYYGADKAAVYPIAKDRTVVGKATQIVDQDKHPHSLLMDPKNRFVYIPNTGASTIYQYRLDAKKGKLLPCEVPKITTVEGSGPRHVIFHPTLDVVYFVNETNSSVSVFRQDPQTGNLSPLQNIPTLPKNFEGRNSCADVEVTPNGRFLYASNRGHDSLAGYRIDQKTGRLTLIDQFPTEKTPREFNIDPSGRFVYSAGQGSGKMISYRINQDTGALVPKKTYDVGKSPAWVRVVRLAK